MRRRKDVPGARYQSSVLAHIVNLLACHAYSSEAFQMMCK